MERRVEPELLDELPPADPRAVRSRRDLLRINAWMGSSGIMARALQSMGHGVADRRIVDLGAGDGRFLLRVARRLHAGWQGTHVVLLDRQNVVSADTRRDFQSLGWRTETQEADALDWLRHPSTQASDVLIANLFLHHFHETQLAGLLRAAAGAARGFIALEPRRSAMSLLFSRLLWVIGCNQVTRHDGFMSVRAGFAGHELSRLWPAGEDWKLREHAAGRFSHLFIAQRRE